MKKDLNMWNRLQSTTVNRGERKELYKVQKAFAGTKEDLAEETDTYFTLLPKGLWRLTDLGSGYILYLFDKPEGQENRNLVEMFIGKTVGDAAKKAVEYIESLKD